MKNDKILIVDDEQSMIDFLDVLLRDEGYIVEASNDSEEAYQRAKLFKPDYALIDVRMEPKNGLWLLKQLKKRHPRLVVIMMTAYISVDEVVDAMKKGAYDYITKPFNITELRAVLKNAQKHIQHPDKTTLDKMEYEDFKLPYNLFNANRTNKLIAKAIFNLQEENKPVSDLTVHYYITKIIQINQDEYINLVLRSIMNDFEMYKEELSNLKIKITV
ncbi:response regulator [PVC group bacterium]|nr:response regulator [PVC group bacterium]